MFRNVFQLPFKILGIPIQLDVTFLIILPLLAWMIGSDIEGLIAAFQLDIDPAPLVSGWMPYLLGLTAAIGLFVSVLIHELGHSIVGQRFGLRIKSITLWILGGMAQFEEIPRDRGKEAIMAIAGPITSFLLAGLAYLLLQTTPAEFQGTRFILTYLMYMNLILAIFNMVPALPLDGGRVFRSLLALRMPYLQATQIATSLSKFLAVMLGLLGFISFNLWMMLIAFFIYIAVSGESQFATVSAMLRGIRVKDLMTEKVQTVYGNSSVAELIQKMFQQRHLAYPVLDGGGDLSGIVTLQHVRRMKASGGKEEETRVEEIMSKEIGRIRQDESALEAFQKISANAAERLVVVDAEDRLLGIISKSDLIRAIQVRMVGMSLDELRDFDESPEAR